MAPSSVSESSSSSKSALSEIADTATSTASISHKSDDYPCVPISGPLPKSVPVSAIEPLTATEPVEVKTELSESKTLKCESREPEDVKEMCKDALSPDIKPKIEIEEIKSELPSAKNSDWSPKSVPRQATETKTVGEIVIKKESDAVVNAGSSPVERALANLETIVSETAAQPRAEDISHPPTEEASLINNKSNNQSQPSEPPSAAMQPQDDSAKLEQSFSEKQNEEIKKNDASEGISANDLSTESEVISKNEGKVPERVATTRGRRRGRGRRGGRHPVEVQDDENSALPLTRSGVSIRGKGRGRGRQTRNSENQELAQTEVKEPVQTEPRRSSRTKRARYHPDMVEHDETSGRRRRGRGGRNAQVEDSRPLPLRTTSDVYDFHESEDEDINLGLAKSSKINKKESSRSAPGRSPAKVDVEEVTPVDNTIENRSGITPTVTRRSGRLRDRVVEDEVSVVKEISEEQTNSESVTPLETPVTSLPSVTSTASLAVSVSTSSVPVTTIARSRGRGKVRESDVDEDALLRKSPRGQIRPLDSVAPDTEKPAAVVLKSVPVTEVSHTTTAVTNVVTVITTTTASITTASTTTASTTTTTTNTTTVVPPVEERKSEAAELVDPATGFVTRVKVCVEGQYVTDSGETSVIPVSQTSHIPDHKQISESPPVTTIVNYTNPSVSIVNVGSPVDRQTQSSSASVGVRTGVSVTIVNSSNISRPIMSAGRIGSDVSVELVNRPRPPMQISRGAASVVSLPSGVVTSSPVMQVASAPAVPSLPSTVAPVIAPTQAPLRAGVPTVVTLSGALRPTTSLPLYITKTAKAVQGQPQQPPQLHSHPHPQALQQLQPHPLQQQQLVKVILVIYQYS